MSVTLSGKELNTYWQRGTLADRPTAGIEGRDYYITDKGYLSRDNGSAWEHNDAFGTGILTAGALCQRPSCLIRSTGRTLDGSNFIEWDTADIDADGFFIPATSDVNIYFPYSGAYLFLAKVYFDSNNSGRLHKINMILNGATFFAESNDGASSSAPLISTCYGYKLDAIAGEYLNVQVTTVGVGITQNGDPEFRAVFLGATF